ncbi:hypothetical protein [Nostoc sp.]
MQQANQSLTFSVFRGLGTRKLREQRGTSDRIDQLWRGFVK